LYFECKWQKNLLLNNNFYIIFKKLLWKILFPNYPKWNSLIYITQSLRLLIKATCYYFYKYQSILKDYLYGKHWGGGTFNFFWKPSAHINIWMTKRLNIKFHYHAFNFKWKNLKQFGVEYHETKHRKQEKKHLNN
jgi:hypothetical protein